MVISPKGMKIICFCIFFLLIIASTAYPSPFSEEKVELKISGGISHLSRTDVDASDKGWSDLRKISMENQGGTEFFEQNPLDWGGEIAGEIIFNLNPRFALCGGVGYISGKNSSKDTATLNEVTTTYTTDMKVKAIPVTLGMYYYPLVASKYRLFFSAGVGYYFASFSRTYLREDNTPYWMNSVYPGSGGDIGFQGGIGFEYYVSKKIAILVEGYGRYAKTSGYEGTRKRNDSNGWSDSLEGKYYYTEREQPTGELFPRVNFGTQKPVSNDIRNERDYETDFSGFTIRVGLNMRLF